MTTQFGTQPKTGGSLFFPQPGVPVCAFTRADLERMHAAIDVKRRAKRDRSAMMRCKRRKYQRKLSGAARIASIDRFIVHDVTPVDLVCTEVEAQTIRCAAAMFGITVADLLATVKTTLFATARRYAVTRLYALGRSPDEIAAVLRRDKTTIYYYLGLKRDARGARGPRPADREIVRAHRVGKSRMTKRVGVARGTMSS